MIDGITSWVLTKLVFLNLQINRSGFVNLEKKTQGIVTLYSEGFFDDGGYLA